MFHPVYRLIAALCLASVAGHSTLSRAAAAPGTCNELGRTGEFQEITPPPVKAGFGQPSVKDGGGTFALAADPVNHGTLYLGTLWQGLWKTTDCGATWKKISGRNSAEINSGMNWTLTVDPQNPLIVYTNSGYGTNSLYRSNNGGKDWDVIWPPAKGKLASAFTYNFANVVALDPENSAHVLLTFHESCLAPHPNTCIAETFDRGATWKLIDGRPEWVGNEGQVIFFLNDSKTWLWGSSSNGFWRTQDSGGSWQAIPGMTTSHLQGSQVARAANGAFYVNGADGIWSSPDGTAPSWKAVPNTGPISGGLVANGTALYASTCYSGNSCKPSDVRFLSSPESDGRNWSRMDNPPMNQGGTMAYDPGYNLLYASGLQAGLWRVKVK
jgi:photosystem II stability/assembly factor-like uncharacterized protein